MMGLSSHKTARCTSAQFKYSNYFQFNFVHGVIYVSPAENSRKFATGHQIRTTTNINEYTDIYLSTALLALQTTAASLRRRVAKLHSSFDSVLSFHRCGSRCIDFKSQQIVLCACVCYGHAATDKVTKACENRTTQMSSRSMSWLTESRGGSSPREGTCVWFAYLNQKEKRAANGGKL